MDLGTGGALAIAVYGAVKFFERICTPAATEFGSYLGERMALYRAVNIDRIVKETKRLLKEDEQLQAHPRIVHEVIENGSWADDEGIQNWWAGLLASSCSKDGHDESNLIFINLLKQIGASQAKLLDHLCENSDPHVSEDGLIATTFDRTYARDDLFQVVGHSDLGRLDREIDALRNLGLINGTLHPGAMYVPLSPTTIAFQMFVRCHGIREAPEEYYRRRFNERKPVESSALSAASDPTNN